jgi:GT2 family glycosyltransferase
VGDLPRLAVIMLNTNEGDVVPRALEALARQERRPDRTIVLDNASTDGSPERIEREFPWVELVRLGRNAGFAAGNNAGVRRADDCDWVFLLNGDAFPEPDCVGALLRAAEANGGDSFFAARMMRATEPGVIDGAGDLYHVSGLAFRRHHGKALDDCPGALLPAETFSVCGGAALYRREAYLDAGGFDESFFGYYEDHDLAFRLRLAGHSARYVPDAVVHHIGSATTGRESEYTVYHAYRNLVWTWVKNMPSPLIWLYLPQHLLVNLLNVAWFVPRGRGGAILRAKRDALRGLPRVLRERRAIQAGRRATPRELRAAMDRGAGAYGDALGRARLARWARA